MSGSNDAHVDPNLFTVFARIKKPGDVGYVEKSIHDEMARIAKEGVDDATLRDVLSHVKYAFAGQLSTADKTAYTASSFIALTGQLESINATSRSTTRSPAPTSSAWPPPTSSRRTAPSSRLKAAQMRWVDTVAHGSESPHPPSLPAPTSRRPKRPKTPTSVAGIRTVFIPSPQSPLCAIRLVFQIGSVDDPAGKEGLAVAHRARCSARGGSKTPHLRRAARRALPAGRRDQHLQRQGDRWCSKGPFTATTWRGSPICWPTRC